MCVNNLPRVATWQGTGLESNRELEAFSVDALYKFTFYLLMRTMLSPVQHTTATLLSHTCQCSIC